MRTTLISATGTLGTSDKLFQTPSVKPAENQPSFQNYLQKSTTQERKEVLTTVENSSRSDGHKKESAPQNTAESKRVQEPKDSNEKTNVETGNTKENDATKSEKVVTEVDENQAELRKVEEWMKKIQKTLNLTNEEMINWLNTLGMTTVDLLDSSKLQNFFMQVKGIDVSELLTEQKTADELKFLLSETAPLKEELAFGSLEKQDRTEFAALIEKVMLDLQSAEDVDKPIISKGNMDQTTSESNFDFGAKEEQPKEIKSEQEPAKTMEWMPENFQKVVESKEQVIVTANGLERVTTTVTVKDIFQQIVTKFTSQNLGDASKVTMQLNPEHLGKIAFQVVSRQGQMTGQFVAESEAVKSAIEAQMSQLKVHLAEQGIRVQEVKVVVGDTVNYFSEDRSGKQDDNSGKQTKKGKKTYIESISNEVEEVAEIKEELSTVSTASVEFTA